MKKLLIATALTAATTVGFSATAFADGSGNQGRAPGGQNHAAAASTLGGEVVSSVMPCHVTSAAPQCEADG